MSDAPAAAAAPGNSTAGKVASELIISERWDKCLERCVARLFLIDHWIVVYIDRQPYAVDSVRS